MKDIIKFTIAAAIFALLFREFFPKRVSTERVIPQIVTQHDTIRTIDTLWKSRIVEHFTTDTFNLVIKQTIVDTVVINNADSTRWPILNYTQLSMDTAIIRTFELGSRRGSISRVFTPGPLIRLSADTLPTPKIAFGSWPVYSPTLATKAKYTLLGAGFALALRGLLK